MAETSFSVPFGAGDTVFRASSSDLLEPVTVVEVSAETFVKVRDAAGDLASIRTTDVITRDQATARIAELQAVLAESE